MDFNIALINPETVSTEMREMYDQHENNALGLIAARLRRLEYQVDLYDLRIDGLTECETAKLLCTRNYRIIGFSVNYATLRSALRISERLQVFHPDNPVIVLGGEHVSYEDMSVLSAFPSADIICRGEAEITFCDVVDAIRMSRRLDDVKGITFRRPGTSQISRNPDREPNPSLDDLPYADHDIAVRAIEYQKPVRVGVLFTRGCPYPCVFCNAQRFLGNETSTVRRRSPENAVDEIESLLPLALKTRSYIHIYDATFVTPSRESRIWIRKFVSEMERRRLTVPMDAFIRADSFNIDKEKDVELLDRLRHVGLISTYLGLEAGDDVQLSHYNKKIVKSGSARMYDFLKMRGMAGSTNGCITFFQTATLPQIMNTMEFLLSLGLHSIWNVLSRAETLPGICLNQQTKMDERYLPWHVTNYSLEHPDAREFYDYLHYLNAKYEVIRLEDRLLRELRDGIKLTLFNQGIYGYSDQEKNFDAMVRDMHRENYRFLNEKIDEITLQGRIIRNTRREHDFITTLSKGLNRIRRTELYDY